jgi:hypothetical protein
MRPVSMPPLQGKGTDDWQTPVNALEPLFIYLEKNWVIWEPAQGKGYLTHGLTDRGFSVIGSDIITGQDFLAWEPACKWDCIVTNPPFSLKQQFIERAYRLRKPFAFLLPLTTFETSKRQALFKEFGIEVILFGTRIYFENKIGNVGRPYFACAWFTNWLNIGSQISFWDLRPVQIGLI